MALGRMAWRWAVWHCTSQSGGILCAAELLRSTSIWNGSFVEPLAV
jgi:hypothetical protein